MQPDTTVKANPSHHSIELMNVTETEFWCYTGCSPLHAGKPSIEHKITYLGRKTTGCKKNMVKAKDGTSEQLDQEQRWYMMPHC